MRKRSLFNSICLIFLMAAAIAVQAQIASDLFEKGLLKEKAEGDIKAAISIYIKVLEDKSADRSTAARAQLRIGLCYEKLGKEEAIKAYEAVVKNYKDQAEQVSQAQLRLSELYKTKTAEASVISLYDEGANIKNGTMLDDDTLSPDGSKLVGIDYSQGQNVATYDIHTKKIQLVTHYDWTTEGHGWTYYPVWSADGNEVAYLFQEWQLTSEYALQVTSLEGETRTLLKKRCVRSPFVPREWSRDGKQILLFIPDSTGYFSIGLVSVDNSMFVPLHKTQWKSAQQEGLISKGGASLSPDGMFVVFSDGPPDNLDLYIMDTAGGEPVLLSGHPGIEHDPIWSPCGRYIVFIRATKQESFLYAIELEDGKPVKQPFLIKEGMQNADLKNWNSTGLTFSTFVDLHDMYTIPMNPETGVTTGAPVPVQFTPTGSNIQPHWSSDGKQIAFISYEGTPKVVIMPADGGDPRYYPIKAPGFWELALWDLNWTPGDKGISFCVTNPDRVPTVCRLDLRTGEWQHWVLPFKGWSRTVWGRDEQTVYYGRNGSDEAGIYSLNIENGESQLLYKPNTGHTFYAIMDVKLNRDRTKLLFDARCDTIGMKVFMIDLLSGEGVVFKEDYNFRSFSPDGSKMIITGKTMADGETVFSADGETLHQYNLRTHFAKGTRMQSIDWSPDGSQMIFSTRSMSFGTYLMRKVIPDTAK